MEGKLPSGRHLDPATFDRTDFLLSRHEGPHVLPHDIFFHRLYNLTLRQNMIAIKDPYEELAITHHQLLSDIIFTRNRIRESLNEQSMDMLRNDQEVCILIVARGYEFVVAFYATLALGAIATPQSPAISPAELAHAAKASNAHATLYSHQFAQLAIEIASSAGVNHNYRAIDLHFCTKTQLVKPESVVFSIDKPRNQSSPAVVIFTSGSTGPPKGSAMRRHDLALLAVAAGWKTQMGPGYTVLQTLPTHHATGLMVNTIPVIFNGGTVEFTNPKFDAAVVWERFREGGISTFSAVPTIYVRLIKYWNDVLSKLPDTDIHPYLQGLREIQQYHCGSAALPLNVAKKWRELCDGRHILERYGGTEFGSPFATSPDMPFVPGSVGIRNPGTETYLEHGDHGQVFTRSPGMFSKYINDIEATRNALTDDGFFKTGDIAEKVGNVFFLKGRQSVDIIKTGGYKVSALDIERELLEHPKIQEAAVIGIDDTDLGQRIGAAVVLKDGVSSLTLLELRDNLKSRLSYYKIPSILRVVPELKKTASLKVPKILLKEDLFGNGHPDIQRLGEGKAKL